MDVAASGFPILHGGCHLDTHCLHRRQVAFETRELKQAGYLEAQSGRPCRAVGLQHQSLLIETRDHDVVTEGERQFAFQRLPQTGEFGGPNEQLGKLDGSVCQEFLYRDGALISDDWHGGQVLAA